jgi:hemerythrin-like domain-containing protein
MDAINQTTVNLLTHQARTEHEELHQLLDEVCNQLCPSNRDDFKATFLGDAIRRLQRHLETHFAHEECGGWLEEAVACAPHLAGRLTKLEREHGVLRKQMAELIEAAKALERAPGDSTEFRVAFDQFATRLLQHESDEERMLAEGFNEELDID